MSSWRTCQRCTARRLGCLVGTVENVASNTPKRQRFSLTDDGQRVRIMCHHRFRVQCAHIMTRRASIGKRCSCSAVHSLPLGLQSRKTIFTQWVGVRIQRELQRRLTTAACIPG
eukprot:782097-Prymnesium_polylepis.2